MKTNKIIFSMVMLSIICIGVFAQNDVSYYVSNNGDIFNDGLSELTPLPDLNMALIKATQNNVHRIVVIGTLTRARVGLVGGLSSGIPNESGEIIITGKKDAADSEKAVLTAQNEGAALQILNKVNIRFENIKITEWTVFIHEGAHVTFGQGSSVCNNSDFGIQVFGTCIIDGGEVWGNLETGIAVGSKGLLSLVSGAIRDNKSSTNCGGVAVLNGGKFIMSGGIITRNNAANEAGGVGVSAGGRFDQTGGIINQNIAVRNPNIYRQQGSFGSNL